MAEGKPGRGSDQFPLRFPDGLRDRIKQAAEANNRSMNAEIIGTLEVFYPPDPPLEALEEELAMLVEDLKTKDDVQHRFELMRTMQEIGRYLRKRRDAKGSGKPEEENTAPGFL